jgi:hypothetical protein
LPRVPPTGIIRSINKAHAAAILTPQKYGVRRLPFESLSALSQQSQSASSRSKNQGGTAIGDFAAVSLLSG